MVKTPRKPSAPATLDTFVRPTPSPSSSTSRGNNLKRSQPASDARDSHKQQQQQKKKRKSSAASAKRPRARKPLLQDNRNLGTLELLDTTDEDDEPTISAAADAKGKGKMRLEEEDWMLSDHDERQQSSSVVVVEPAAKKKVFGTRREIQPVVVASTSRVVHTETTIAATSKPVQEMIELSSDDDDDDDADRVRVSQAVACPSCNLGMETLPIKERNSHVDLCLERTKSSGTSSRAASSLTTTTKPSLLGRNLFAPISRLFSNRTTSATATDDKETNTKPLTSRLPNAFTALMAGHVESTQWREADQASQQKGRLPKGTDRKVPFYKWIDGMEITVDAFRYGKIEGCKGYFLSHAHSDHYQNLSSSWQHGPIYCSLTTANLIKLKLNVDDKWVIPLPLNETVKVQGIDVTLIDANHCPGSVLFLFEGPHTDPKSPYSKTPSRIFRHLHCGDFRASPAHVLHPSMSFPHAPPPQVASLLPKALQSRTPKRLDSIYLDTTYLSPSYCFPAQELVIEACADLVKERVLDGNEEALWRADGREAERKGIKGWLNPHGGSTKVEQGAGAENEGFEMLEALPEENEREGAGGDDDSGGCETDNVRGRGEADDEDGGDEEEWNLIREMDDTENDSQRRVVSQDESAGDFTLQAAEQVQPVDETDDSLKAERAPGVDEPLKAEQEEDAKPRVVSQEDDEKPDLSLDEDKKPPVADVDGDEKPKPDVRTERLLVMIGTYSIGKERIVKAIAHALSTKIYADPRKKELFLAQDDPDLHALLTDDPLEAQVHVGWLSSIARDAMLEYLAKYKAPRCPGGFNKMIGLRPTGWTYRSESKDKFPSIPKILQLEQSRKFSPAGLYPQRDSTPQCMAFGVPYSEHSSFFELTCFCLSLDYVRIIPTVNVHNVNSRNKMKEWIDRWAAEKKRRQDARMPRVVPYRNVNYW